MAVSSLYSPLAESHRAASRIASGSIGTNERIIETQSARTPISVFFRQGHSTYHTEGKVEDNKHNEEVSFSGPTKDLNKFIEFLQSLVLLIAKILILAEFLLLFFGV
jgi:hypothetical protein